MLEHSISTGRMWSKKSNQTKQSKKRLKPCKKSFFAQKVQNADLEDFFVIRLVCHSACNNTELILQPKKRSGSLYENLIFTKLNNLCKRPSVDKDWIMKYKNRWCIFFNYQFLHLCLLKAKSKELSFTDRLSWGGGVCGPLQMLPSHA